MLDKPYDQIDRGRNELRAAHVETNPREQGLETFAVPASELLSVIAKSLERIETRLNELPAEIARALKSGAERPLRRVDRERLTPLVTAAWLSIGPANFLARELLELATVDERFRGALAPAVAGHASPARALGRLLLRGQGFALDGLTVRRIASTRSGSLWQIERI